MAILVEGFAVIVRRQTINERFPGGWTAFEKATPPARTCEDGKLVSTSFEDEAKACAFIASLTSRGLTFAGAAPDIALASPNAERIAPWLETSRIKQADGAVLACWLFDEPRIPVPGVHLKSLQFDLHLPPGWQYAGSLTEKFSRAPSTPVPQHKAARSTFNAPNTTFGSSPRRAVPSPKLLSEEIDKLVVTNLTANWGGQLPTWEEFKQAKADGRVRVNKSVATKTLFWKGVPKTFQLLFGIVVPYAAFLVIPVSVGLYYFSNISAWWIVGSVFVAWYLFATARKGQCDGVSWGAERNAELYDALVRRGAFDILPPKDVSKGASSSP